MTISNPALGYPQTHHSTGVGDGERSGRYFRIQIKEKLVSSGARVASQDRGLARSLPFADSKSDAPTMAQSASSPPHSPKELKQISPRLNACTDAILQPIGPSYVTSLSCSVSAVLPLIKSDETPASALVKYTQPMYDIVSPHERTQPEPSSSPPTKTLESSSPSVSDWEDLHHHRFKSTESDFHVVLSDAPTTPILSTVAQTGPHHDIDDEWQLL